MSKSELGGGGGGMVEKFEQVYDDQIRKNEDLKEFLEKRLLIIREIENETLFPRKRSGTILKFVGVLLGVTSIVFYHVNKKVSISISIVAGVGALIFTGGGARLNHLVFEKREESEREESIRMNLHFRHWNSYYEKNRDTMNDILENLKVDDENDNIVSVSVSPGPARSQAMDYQWNKSSGFLNFSKDLPSIVICTLNILCFISDLIINSEDDDTFFTSSPPFLNTLLFLFLGSMASDLIFFYLNFTKESKVVLIMVEYINYLENHIKHIIKMRNEVRRRMLAFEKGQLEDFLEKMKISFQKRGRTGRF